MTTPADELRTAAARLRQLAADATDGPWRQHDTHLGQYGYTATVLSGEGNDTDLRAWLPTWSHEPWDQTRNAWQDAAYIAAMHPGVGAAVADWLDQAAQRIGHYQTAAARVFDLDTPAGQSDAEAWVADHIKRIRPALAVARLINQEGS